MEPVPCVVSSSVHESASNVNVGDQPQCGDSTQQEGTNAACNCFNELNTNHVGCTMDPITVSAYKSFEDAMANTSMPTNVPNNNEEAKHSNVNNNETHSTYATKLNPTALNKANF